MSNFAKYRFLAPSLKKLLYSRKGFFRDNVAFAGVVLNVLFIIILLLTVIFKIRPGSGTVALHYNVLVGVGVLGKAWHVFILPVLASLIAFYNFVLARRFYVFEPFASHILIIASAVTSAMFLMAGVALTFLQ